MNLRHAAAVFVWWACAVPILGEEGAGISLAGEWRFALDRADRGVADRWFAGDLDGGVELPGSLAVRRIGDEVGTNTAWTGGIIVEGNCDERGSNEYNLALGERRLRFDQTQRDALLACPSRARGQLGRQSGGLA